jgi:NTP pyrophosphatase (non-canonical NTP hydrolase)
MMLLSFFHEVLNFYNHFYVVHAETKPSIEKATLKMVEEVGEFAGTLAKSRPKIEQEDEWADILFSHLHIAILGEFDMKGAMGRVAMKNREKLASAVVINGMIVKQEDVGHHGLE